MSHSNIPSATGPDMVARRSAHSGAAPGARGIRLGNLPTVSIVVASTGPRSDLEACIETLLPVCRTSGIELVVARSTTPGEFRELEQRYRAALFMPAPDASSARVLRSFGIAAAEGDIVVFTDDSRLPDAEWLRHIAALTAPAAPS